MTDPGRIQAERHIDELPEPRRSQMRHLHETILAAVPSIDVRMRDYGGGSMIGYGTYPYSTSKGPAGDWFALGLASRKAYISLYSMAFATAGISSRPSPKSLPRGDGGSELPEHREAGAHDDAAVRDLMVATWAQLQGRVRAGSPV